MYTVVDGEWAVHGGAGDTVTGFITINPGQEDSDPSNTFDNFAPVADKTWEISVTLGSLTRSTAENFAHPDYIEYNHHHLEIQDIGYSEYKDYWGIHSHVKMNGDHGAWIRFDDEYPVPPDGEPDGVASGSDNLTGTPFFPRDISLFDSATGFFRTNAWWGHADGHVDFDVISFTRSDAVSQVVYQQDFSSEPAFLFGYYYSPAPLSGCPADRAAPTPYPYPWLWEDYAGWNDADGTFLLRIIETTGGPYCYKYVWFEPFDNKILFYYYSYGKFYQTMHAMLIKCSLLSSNSKSIIFNSATL